MVSLICCKFSINSGTGRTSDMLPKYAPKESQSDPYARLLTVAGIFEKLRYRRADADKKEQAEPLLSSACLWCAPGDAHMQQGEVRWDRLFEEKIQHLKFFLLYSRYVDEIAIGGRAYFYRGNSHCLRKVRNFLWPAQWQPL